MVSIIAAFKQFQKDPSGAVAVDWVVLVAALVGLTIAVFSFLAGGMDAISNEVAIQMSDQEITDEF